MDPSKNLIISFAKIFADIVLNSHVRNVVTSPGANAPIRLWTDRRTDGRTDGWMRELNVTFAKT